VSSELGQEQACARLGVDAFGLERLIALGDMIASGDPGARRFDAATLETCAKQRNLRRAQALAELARIDGPHLAGPGRDPAP
jgi:hypothetical protein